MMLSLLMGLTPLIRHIYCSVDVRMQVIPVSLLSKNFFSKSEKGLFGVKIRKGNLLTSMFDNFRRSGYFSLLFRFF